MEGVIFAAGNPFDFLTQFGVDWRLLTSQALSFAIVAAALYYFVFRPVIAVSSKRQQEISKGLEDARIAGERLAAAESEAVESLKKTALEASKILEQARENAKKTVEDAVNQANARSAQIEARMQAQLGTEKEQMKRQLRDELSGLVVNAAEAVVAEVLTPEQRGRLAELAVKKLSEK